ncbi:O-antigen ligase family protein [Granulicella sibirica]|uniref:Glucose-6-phosphate isomerase n=1 Tax=Granulicella sibirica TaxID=2479048 RepID=A0A4Q0T8A9_9BACT|nr:O-antigen ligase family protein [Granulicella sibirica]RXH58388.1 Glucose-6-phosphate isomerase [Granulicella sibirica]
MRETAVVLPTKTIGRKDSSLSERPSEKNGWLALAAFLGITALLLIAIRGRVVEVAFTPLAIVVGVYLLFRYERIYLVHTVILLCCTPFVHRVADNGGTIVEHSPMLAAPILVTFLSVLRIGKFRLLDPQNLVYVLALLGVLYGAFVGFLRNGVAAAAVPLLGWLCPLMIGMFCYLQEDSQQSLARMFNRAVMVVGGIVAVYGVLQFFAPFAWDTYWLAQLQAQGQAISMGTPEALHIRVFSTCNNSQAAGSLLGYDILVTCVLRFRWKLVAIVSPILALALTSVRSAWVACACAGVVLFIRAGTKAKIQTVFVLGILLVLGVAAASTPAGSTIADRLTSFGSVKNDTSYREREIGRKAIAKVIGNEPFGLGIGYVTSFEKTASFAITDQGVVTMPMELGYLGVTLYGIAIAMLLFGPLWKGIRSNGEILMLALGMLYIIFLFANTNPLNTALGVFFWVPASLMLKFFTTQATSTNKRLQKAYAPI